MELLTATIWLVGVIISISISRCATELITHSKLLREQNEILKRNNDIKNR